MLGPFPERVCALESGPINCHLYTAVYITEFFTTQAIVFVILWMPLLLNLEETY